ncbi:hypothetical protein GWI33_018042 [Rhynchophorus ferrugineus]|uniref:Uncharacterized protein n=1 Tax=Rhynchophorus ferrugineus TaxID=354439 RepID=A0A834I831_RHYFE|nr:hypothetical protein GWI33_018042 [Rhynchophorus ferrugineus]
MTFQLPLLPLPSPIIICIPEVAHKERKSPKSLPSNKRNYGFVHGNSSYADISFRLLRVGAGALSVVPPQEVRGGLRGRPFSLLIQASASYRGSRCSLT